MKDIGWGEMEREKEIDKPRRDGLAEGPVKEIIVGERTRCITVLTARRGVAIAPSRRLLMPRSMDNGWLLAFRFRGRLSSNTTLITAAG